ncbi:hypothetical protein [Isorropodon fossajaponicum symbiont]|nr:hypothetical protein [Isorropodon fossajaponicum symbiont]
MHNTPLNILFNTPLRGGTLDYAKLMVHENYTNKKNHDNIRSLLLSS